MKGGGMILVAASAVLAPGCTDQSEQGQVDQGSQSVKKQNSAEQAAEYREFESWLEDRKKSVLNREIADDGEITKSGSGKFVLAPQSRICGLSSEIDPRMNDLVPDRDWGGAVASFDGEVIADLFDRLSLELNVNGSPRIVTVPSAACKNLHAGNIHYFTVARPNSEGRPYRFDLMVWQKRGRERAFWSGSIARPYMPTWKGRPLKSDAYEAKWGGRGRVDRDGNLPDGTPFWSIGTDGIALTKAFISEFDVGAGND